MDLQQLRCSTRPRHQCGKKHSRGGTSPSCRRNPRSLGRGGSQRDWLPIVVAAVLIAVHHLVFFWLEAQQFPVWAYPEGTEFWTVSIHALFVVLETAMLVVMSIRMRQEAIESAAVSMLAQVMSNGDLAAQIEIEGAQAHSKLFNSVVEMQTKFRRLMRGIAEHAVTVHDNCASLHHASQTVAEHSARQSDSAQRISSEVKHLTDSFNTVASFAVPW